MPHSVRSLESKRFKGSETRSHQVDQRIVNAPRVIKYPRGVDVQKIRAHTRLQMFPDVFGKARTDGHNPGLG